MGALNELTDQARSRHSNMELGQRDGKLHGTWSVIRYTSLHVYSGLAMLLATHFARSATVVIFFAVVILFASVARNACSACTKSHTTLHTTLS
jgi:hypothetical protein